MVKDKKYEVVLLRGTTKFLITVTATARNDAVEEAKKKMSQGNLAKVMSVRLVGEVVNGKWIKR